MIYRQTSDNKVPVFFLFLRLIRWCGAMQRLYIGGLSHTITQKDLKDRFGKFGDVQDVELRTRRDDDGKETFNETIPLFQC